MQKEMKTYNDGYLHIYRQNQAPSDFGAVLNTRTTNDMEYIIKLAYSERSKREEDIEWAESCDRTLSFKAVCPLADFVKTSYQVVCTGKLYSIINIDYDRKNREMYLYMEEVRDIAE